MMGAVLSGIPTIGVILAAMALVALLEVAIPLSPRDRWHQAHRAPNLALTFITFATNLVMNGALVMALVRLESTGFGLVRMLSLPPLATTLAVVLGLDFSFYVAHVSMHGLHGFWRFHRVHHSDPAVDVTTTIRQHPGEGVIRYAFMGAFAFALGASPGAFAVYRSLSVLNGLLEHANVRVPPWLDGMLSLVTTWPNVHKVHHSRAANETNTNYGNIFSLFDRLFSTFTPSSHGVNVSFGLDGFDDPVSQTTAGLLAMPFRTEGSVLDHHVVARRGVEDVEPGTADEHVVARATVHDVVTGAPDHYVVTRPAVRCEHAGPGSQLRRRQRIVPVEEVDGQPVGGLRTADVHRGREPLHGDVARDACN
jgi:sterol desaturase/sphingolipid hydroxylase (fatty acid hydroxylase superfamily)